MAEWSKAPDSSSGLREKAWVQIPLLTLFSPFSLKFLLLAKTVRFEQKRCVSIDNRNGTFETNAAFRCRFTFIFLKQSLTALEIWNPVEETLKQSRPHFTATEPSRLGRYGRVVGSARRRSEGYRESGENTRRTCRQGHRSCEERVPSSSASQAL